MGESSIKQQRLAPQAVKIISGEMLFGDKGRIECIIEDDKQVNFIIDGEEKKIVIERI